MFRFKDWTDEWEETRKRRCQGWFPAFLAKFLKLEIPEEEKLFGRKDDASTSAI